MAKSTGGRSSVKPQAAAPKASPKSVKPPVAKSTVQRGLPQNVRNGQR